MGGRGTSSGRSTNQIPWANNKWANTPSCIGPQQSPPPAPPQPAQQVQPAPTQMPLPPAPRQTSLDQLSKMNDNQVLSILKTAEHADLPNHLKDKYDPTQQLVYTIGLNAPPQVMDKKSFDAFRHAKNISSSQIMTREVNGGKFRTTAGTSRNLTSQQVAQMWTSDPYNYIGGKHGGQALGAGAYFDMNGGRSSGYGRSNSTSTYAILNPNTAKVVTTGRLTREAARWAQTHPKADAQLQKMARRSQASFGNAQYSLYAAVLGYNVITSGGSYYNVIDRSAVIVRQ